ncbi:hypothetical protein Bbelb_283170 [Branchiostoma belcheri]|nr:hypothetical protein Bbelb_283170 [Branchiostoma belcheri]
MYDGRPIPFAMALMTTKTVGAYRQVLQHVKEKGPAANGTSAVGIVSDFELALITAHKTEFPDATVSGCISTSDRVCGDASKTLAWLGRTYRRDTLVNRCLRKVMSKTLNAMLFSNFKISAPVFGNMNKEVESVTGLLVSTERPWLGALLDSTGQTVQAKCKKGKMPCVRRNQSIDVIVSDSSFC